MAAAERQRTGTALITGGDRGIGYALSRRLAADGWRLLWVARTPAHLDEGAARLQSETGARPSTYACDLSEPDAAERTHAWVEEIGAQPELLVNNAGFGGFGLLTELPLERDLAMLRLNNAAVHRLTRLFLDDMQRRGRGTIVNVASVAGLIPMPGFAAYAGTKAFVHQYTRCLDLELRATGSPVRAISVCPAAVRDTGFQREAGMQRTSIFRDPLATTPDLVARDIQRALRTGRRVVISGTALRWLLPVARLLPEWLQSRYLVARYRRELSAASRDPG